MMMLYRWLIPLVLFGAAGPLVGQMPSIPYDSVLNRLLDDYYPDLTESEFLSISRQPDGYYVGVQRVGNVFARSQYPYYLNGDTKFRDLPFRRRTQDDLLAHHATETAGHWRRGQFRRHLYFGYPGFTQQSIEVLSEKEYRSPRETQMLARAHAEMAMNLLNNQYGTSNPELRFDLDEDNYQYLDKKQLKEYLEHQVKAIRYYGELPVNHPTPVGSGQTKQANEWLNGYLTLLQYNSRQVANEFISQMPPAYDEHLRLCAELLLESVPINGLLIVEGDNDTYPLLYLQLKEDIRTDVLVINRHLLNHPRYVRMLRQGKQIGGALPLTTDDALIHSWAGKSYMPGNRYDLYTADQVLQVLGDISAYSRASVMQVLPFGGMQLSTKVDGPIFRPEARPLRSGNLVMMDLIATNFRDGRQVAVSATINQDYFAYANSWQQVGLVYNLGDEKPSYNIDLEGTLAWSTDIYRNTPIATAGKQSAFFLDQLEDIVVRTASALRRGNQSDLAGYVLNRYLSHLDYKYIFNRRGSLKLLRELDANGFDVVTLTAYATYLRDQIEEKPAAEHSPGEIAALRSLYYYVAHGEFPNRTSRGSR